MQKGFLLRNAWPTVLCKITICSLCESKFEYYQTSDISTHTVTQQGTNSEPKIAIFFRYDSNSIPDNVGWSVGINEEVKSFKVHKRLIYQ